MEFSPQVSAGLQTAGDSVHIPDDAFLTILQHTVSCILESRESSHSKIYDHQQISQVDKVALQQSHAALATLLLEAAKHDAQSTAISSVLEDCKFSTDRIAEFNQVYSQNKQQLRIMLSSIGSRHPHVVDVDWRLDYYIKNNNMDKLNETIFLIKMKTEEQGKDKLKDVQFTCTQDQLQDLVGKLKDACKSLERASQH